MSFPRIQEIQILDSNNIQETNNSDEDDDEDKSITTLVAFNKNCCVKTILVTCVVTTAIVMVVIVASNKQKDVSQVEIKAPGAQQSVYWMQNSAHKQLVFEHQFLLRDPDGHQPLQVIAIDDVRRAYVIVWYEMDKHFNLYILVDFEKNIETVLVVSKSQNTYATDVQENAVLFCQTKRFDRAFLGEFATVSDVLKSSGLEVTFVHSKVTYAVTYIGGPLTLERFISTVVNSSCDDLSKADVFKWNSPDESLACGEKVYSETEREPCSQDLCQIFPGIPLSKGQICHQFRRCNFMKRSCDPYYSQNPSKMDSHPYCICRKTATKNADELSCPRVADDGGECEIPRRDLLVTHRNLPCLCLYRFQVVYPYTTKSERANLENTAKQQSDILKWYGKEEIVTGPALTFSQCHC